MTTENEESPVRHFCAQLDGFVRAAGQTRSYVVSRHPMSDSQVYAVLAGTVKTPPSFDRMVVPIVEICGGDAAVIAQWRTRHDTMVRVYELQKSLRRKAAAETTAADAPPGFDVPEGYNRFGTVDPQPVRRSRWPLLIVAIVAVAGVLAGGLTWSFAANQAEPTASGPAPQPPVGANLPTSADAADTLCKAGPPADGGDLMEVELPDAPGDPKFAAWWSTTERVRLESFETHSWTATAESGSGLTRWEMLVIRGCLPVTKGHNYTLSFTASASADVTIGVRVQDDQPPRPESLLKEFAVGTDPQPHTWTFVGHTTSQTSELTFQLGGNPAFGIAFTDVVLTDLGA